MYSQYKQAGAQSDMATNNAKAASAQQADALMRGEINTSRMGIRNAAVLGGQTASFGASGVQLGSGSPEAVLAANRGALAQDTEMARYNSQLEAWGFQTQAANARAQAGLYDNAAVGSLITGGLGMGGSLLGGGAEYFRARGAGGSMMSSLGSAGLAVSGVKSGGK